MPARARGFVLSYATLVLTCAAIDFLLNYAFLTRSGELLDVREIARVQQTDNALYSSAVHENLFAYKMAIYSARRPAVLAIGSSRVLKFHSYAFRTPFANLGSAMRNVAEGEIAVSRLLEIQAPRLALVGIDFWWFHPGRDEQEEFPGHLDFRPAPSRIINLPLRWLWEDKLGLATYLRTAVGGRDRRYIGVQALLQDKGFEPDGSFEHYGLARGLVSGDRGFESTLDRIEKGENGFEPGAAVDQARLDRLEAMVERLRRRGTQVIVFLPPMPALVLDRMASHPGRFAYVDALRGELARRFPSFYDFHDPRRLGSSDCEFLDGLHGGDVTYLRILQEMSATRDGPLHGYIEEEKTRALIATYVGRAIVPRPLFAASNEVDFLGLGCDKSGITKRAASFGPIALPPARPVRP